MNRYRVYYRKNSDQEWSDEFYSEPYITAEDKEEALRIAEEFAIDCGYEPSNYDWMVQDAEQ